MTQPFRVTRRQQRTLVYLRRLLAEEGCFIFPVAKPLRRHRKDFIALPKNSPSHFLRVRPTSSGKVIIQSFVPLRHLHLKTKLFERTRKLGAWVQWHGSALGHAHERPDVWNNYLPRDKQYEVGRLLTMKG